MAFTQKSGDIKRWAPQVKRVVDNIISPREGIAALRSISFKGRAPISVGGSGGGGGGAIGDGLYPNGLRGTRNQIWLPATAAFKWEAGTPTVVNNWLEMVGAIGVTYTFRWFLMLPSDYDGGTITPNVVGWNAAIGGGGNIRLAISMGSHVAGDAFAFGTAQQVVFAAQAQYDAQPHEWPAVTAAGTPAAGEMLVVDLSRDSTHLSDTYTDSFYCLGIGLTYTRS